MMKKHSARYSAPNLLRTVFAWRRPRTGKSASRKAKALKPDLDPYGCTDAGDGRSHRDVKASRDPDKKTSKVVFLTSLGDPRLEMQAMNRKIAQDFGVKGYLRKTDDLGVLSDRVKEFLQ